MFFVYMDSYYGKELIGTAKTREEAEMIKAHQDKNHSPGDLWQTRISEEQEKEFTFFD